MQKNMDLSGGGFFFLFSSIKTHTTPSASFNTKAVLYYTIIYPPFDWDELLILKDRKSLG